LTSRAFGLCCRTQTVSQTVRRRHVYVLLLRSRFEYVTEGVYSKEIDCNSAIRVRIINHYFPSIFASFATHTIYYDCCYYYYYYYYYSINITSTILYCIIIIIYFYFGQDKSARRSVKSYIINVRATVVNVYSI
jgi:hypothetical protein